MRALLGCGGRAFLNWYRSAGGGFQNRASYTGETDRSCVTLVIHAGSRSTRAPEGRISEICASCACERRARTAGGGGVP